MKIFNLKKTIERKILSYCQNFIGIKTVTDGTRL